MGDATTGHPRAGDWIAGKYQVEQVLGAGGMGVVVAARHVALKQPVAVKFLLPSATRFPDATERFLREAQAAVAIRSEHVARVLDVGTLETGAPYMVMEYLAGTDLRALARARGPLPVVEAVDFVLQAGEAIAEAHSLGIVHRDLKPANIFLTSRADGSPLVKVLDFGLSKVTGSDPGQERGLTATDVVAGSPEYMSPEQVRSLKDVDHRTDIWALGVVLYELLTGHRPFQGPTAAAVCAGVAADTPAPVRSRRPDLPEGIERVIDGCLVKDRDKRIRTMGELAAALAPFATTQSASSIERILRMSAGGPGGRGSMPDVGSVRSPGPTGVTGPAATFPHGAPQRVVVAAAPGAISGGPDGPLPAANRQDGTVTLPRSGHAAIGAPLGGVVGTQGPRSAALPETAPMLGPSATQGRAPSHPDPTTGRSGHTDGWGETRRSRAPSRSGPLVAVLGAAAAVVITLGVVLWQVLGAAGDPASGAAQGASPSKVSTTSEAPGAPGSSGEPAIVPAGPLFSAVPPPTASAASSASPTGAPPASASASAPAAAVITGPAAAPKPAAPKPPSSRPVTTKPPPPKFTGSVLDTPL